MWDVKNKITLNNTFETDKHNSYIGLIENDSAWITSCNVLRSCFQLLNLEFLKGISSSSRLTYENTYFKYLSVLQIKNYMCRCLYTGKAKLIFFSEESLSLSRILTNIVSRCIWLCDCIFVDCLTQTVVILDSRIHRASSSYFSYFFLFFSAYSYFSYFLAISSYFSYFLVILLFQTP